MFTALRQERNRESGGAAKLRPHPTDAADSWSTEDWFPDHDKPNGFGDGGRAVNRASEGRLHSPVCFLSSVMSAAPTSDSFISDLWIFTHLALLSSSFDRTRESASEQSTYASGVNLRL